MGKTLIEWTDETWNPVSGCTKVSAGCKHCYAERTWIRLSAPNMPYEGRKFTDVRCHPERLGQPLRWKKPRRIFVNSMSDLFHEDVPFDFIANVFYVMWQCPQHTFQILTKRPKRMALFMRRVIKDVSMVYIHHEYLKGHYKTVHIANTAQWPLKNVWLGVSVENLETAVDRIPPLLETPASVRFLSCEPLLGPIDFIDVSNVWYVNDYRPWRNAPILTDIHWVIVGGESGYEARPMYADWARSIRDQCQRVGVPFFFKQWGEFAPNWFNDDNGKIVGSEWMDRMGKKMAGRVLDGRTWEEYPE